MDKFWDVKVRKSYNDVIPIMAVDADKAYKKAQEESGVVCVEEVTLVKEDGWRFY